jgi:hypothetical protein
MNQVRTAIAGREFTLERAAVERRLSRELPDPLRDHYVVIGGRRFPPKQVVSLVTGLDRADFNTHQARGVLSRLGFTVGRRSRDQARPRPDRSGKLAESRSAAPLPVCNASA